MELTFHIDEQISPIAVYAAIVATLVLMWDIWKWRHSGPRLKISISPFSYIVHGDRVADHPSLIFEVSNTGEKPIILTSARFSFWPNRVDKCRNKNYINIAIINCDIQQYTLPWTLEVGGRWMGMLSHDERLYDMARKGCLFLEISHNFSKKPARARFKIKRSSA